MTERVVLEVAPKRAFASALDWPGWSRSGRTEADALRALIDHGPRFAGVARRAGLPFRAPSSVRDLEIVERLTGGGVTEFGAPGKAAAAEETPISAADLARLHALMTAAWAAFDDATELARGVQLATGPRGGAVSWQRSSTTCASPRSRTSASSAHGLPPRPRSCVRRSPRR